MIEHPQFDGSNEACEELATTLLFKMSVKLGPCLDFGGGPVGHRILFPSAGGHFAGPRVRGEVLAGGGDWALFRADGTMVIDVRLSLKTDDGALIYMSYLGRWATPQEIRPYLQDPVKKYELDPGLYYFRTTPLFETASKDYHWLNDTVSIGSGYLIPGGVGYRVSAVF